MSDYFAALLRSGGMALPQATGSPRSAAEHAAPGEASPAEQPPMRYVPASDAIGEPWSQPARAPTPPTVTAPIESEPASRLPRDAISDDAAASAPTLAVHRNPAAPSATAGTEEAPHAPRPPLRHALIDAALRWVAAGEAPHRHPPTPANEPALRLADSSVNAASRAEASARRIEDPIAHAHRVASTVAHLRDNTSLLLAHLRDDTSVLLAHLRDDTSLPFAHVRDDTSLPFAHVRDSDSTPLPVAHERSTALPPLRSEALPIAARRAAAAPDGDPPLDISIGAIHVRVDAPPAQTVAQALAPRQAVAARAQPGRSGLARRALRRI